MKGPASGESQLQAIETSRYRLVFKKVVDTGEFVSGRDRTGLEQTGVYAFELCYREQSSASGSQTSYPAGSCINPFRDSDKKPIHFLGSLLPLKSDAKNLSKAQKDRLEEIKKISSQIKGYQDAIAVSEKELGKGSVDLGVLVPMSALGAGGGFAAVLGALLALNAPITSLAVPIVFVVFTATGAVGLPGIHESRHPGSIVVDKEGLEADIAKHSAALEQYRKGLYSELVDDHHGLERFEQRSYYAVVSTWNDLVSTDPKDVTTLNATHMASYIYKLSELLNQMNPEKKIEFVCNISLNSITASISFSNITSEVCVQTPR